jgi:hypothetical protein
MDTLRNAVPIWTRTHAEVEAALTGPNQLRTELNTLSGQSAAPCAPVSAQTTQTTSAIANPS